MRTVGMRSLVVASGVMLVLVAILTALAYWDATARQGRDLDALAGLAVSNIPDGLNVDTEFSPELLAQWHSLGAGSKGRRADDIFAGHAFGVWLDG